MIVVRRRAPLVPDIMHEGPLERLDRCLVAETFGESLQYRQIRRAFEIKNPFCLLGLVILIEPDIAERLSDLASATCDPVWLPNERDNQIPTGGFIEKHLRMTRRDDLVAAFQGHLGDQLIGLALAKDLQMCVGFVQQNDRAGIGVHIRQDEQRLLQSLVRWRKDRA